MKNKTVDKILFLLLTLFLNTVLLKADGGIWSDVASIPGSGCSWKSHNPQIAFDCSGNAFAVWKCNVPVPVDRRIKYSHYDVATDSWSTGTPFPGQPAQDCQDPQIAFDCSGNAFAVWEQGNRIYYSYYDVSTGWNNATTIPGQPAQDGQDPQIAFDCSGNASSVWEQGDRIYYSYYDASTGSWSNATKFSEQPANSGENPQIAFDCSGNAFAVWQQLDPAVGNKWQIFYSCYDVSTDSWSNAIKFPGHPDADRKSPQIAFDCSSGNAFAVWQNYSINYSRYDAVPAPSSISTKQEFHRFPTQVDLINVLWWDPVTYLNPIVKYRIYCAPYNPQEPCCENCCNCKIICCVCPCVGATLIGETQHTLFYHYNRCCQWVTYCVTAVDSQGNETPVPASVTVPPPEPPPSNLRACQELHRFSTQGDLINIVCWNPVSNTVEYKVYTYEQFPQVQFTVHQNNNPFFWHHCRRPRCKDIYYIVAIDVNGSKSAPATITVP